MGEMSDYYNEHCDPFDDDPDVTCKHCGKKHLNWEMTPAGWRLFEGDALHECIDPFELVSSLEKRHAVAIKQFKETATAFTKKEKR